MHDATELRQFHFAKVLSRCWIILLPMALVAAACSTSTTITASTDEPPALTEAVAPTASTDEPGEPQPTATPQPQAPDPDPTATPDTADAEPDNSESGEELGVGEASVGVIEVGAEPRIELRFQIASTCGEISTLTQSQELAQVIDGVPLGAAGVFGTIFESATTATPVGDNFDVRSEIVSAQSTPGTDPAVAAGLDVELERLIGLATTVTMTDRGVQIPGSSRVEGAEALGPLQGVLEGLSQAQAPLPVEAVGVGARWETRSVIEVQGLRVETISQIELVSIQGTVLELRSTGTQEVAEGSQMDLNGTLAEVTQWDLAATATTIVDLATISPISMKSVGEATQSFSVELGAQQSELVQDIRTEIEMITEPNDGCTGRSTQP